MFLQKRREEVFGSKPSSKSLKEVTASTSTRIRAIILMLGLVKKI